MRLFIAALLLTGISLLSNAQQLGRKTLYYNYQWELTKKDSSIYYRDCLLDTIRKIFIGEVKDYNTAGQLLMTGAYQTGKKEGTFISYYPSGQVESHGEFKSYIRIGTWSYFYPNGKPMREVKFPGDGSFFVVSAFDEAGNQIIKDGTGTWICAYTWFNQPKSIIVKGSFVNGKKDGLWICSDADGNVLYEETFKKDVFKRGRLKNENSYSEYPEEFPNKFLPHFKHDVTEQFFHTGGLVYEAYPYLFPKPLPPAPTGKYDSIDDSKKVFLVVESPPEFEGGLEAMYKFISKNTYYPADAIRMKIEGNVFVEFVVDEKGSIVEPRIIKGISPSCDQEALRVVKSMPLWRPGTQSGRPVRVKFVMPIKFNLNSAKKR